MKKLLLSIFSLSLLSVSIAWAEEGKTAPLYDKTAPLYDKFVGQQYGTAGCGLGSVVFGDKPGMVQIFAATTNGIAGNQTFGITSGTLNCENRDKKTASLHQQVKDFLVMNKVALQNDIARSQGETIASLNNLIGCDDVNLLTANLKQNYQSIFTAKEDALMANNIIDSVRADQSLKCQF